MADPPTLQHDTVGTFRRASFGTEELVIRFATPDDRNALAELFDSLSFDDRYLRFFSAFRPDNKFLERLAGANVHGARELIAVVTAEGNDRRLVGEAGAWPLRNGNGELEITVAPGHRGWLGPYLLDAALEAAAEAGMPNVEADLMLSNREMLALLRSRGVAVVGHDGYISIRVVISTSGRVPTWAPKDGRPRVLVETFDGRWNGDDAVKTNRCRWSPARVRPLDRRGEAARARRRAVSARGRSRCDRCSSS